MAKIDPNHKPSHTHKAAESKEVYSRFFDMLLNSVGTATAPFFASVARLWTALARSNSSFKHRISRNPTQKSAGKTDSAANRQLFENRATMTRQTQLKGTTPFDGG